METKFSYTNRDIEASRREGISQIPVLSNGNWTDLNPTDPGIIIIDYVHALADMIQFYQDHQALEAYMENATERRNILKLARQISYKAKSSTGASTEVEFYTEYPLTSNVPIPAGTKVAANLLNTTYNYLTVEDIMLYAGQTSAVVSVKEGEIASTTYKGTGISELSQTQNPTNQTFEIVEKGVDMDTIKITDDTGHVWEVIDFIFFADADERRFEVVLTPQNTILIKFGNGQRGKVPLESDTLTIQYMKTNGALGNVGANRITSIISDIRDDNDSQVVLSVRNPSAATGGADPQTDQSIKEQAPKSLKTLWRAVTADDFEVLAKEIPGVANAKALDIKNSPELCLHHEVKLLIVPEGGSTPSKLLKDAVFNDLYKRTIPPTVLQILDPVYQDIGFSFRVAIDKRYMKEEVEYSIRKALAEYFQSIGTSFGQTIRYTALITLTSSVNGVLYISDFSLKEDIQLSKIQMPRLGEVVISYDGEG